MEKGVRRQGSLGLGRGAPDLHAGARLERLDRNLEYLLSPFKGPDPGPGTLGGV